MDIGSLLTREQVVDKMPGDDWQKFANLRLLYGYMYGQPGKKLLFMGCEWGQWQEWKHELSLDWHQLQSANHSGLQHWVQDLNRVYRQQPALYEGDCQPEGFEWIDCDDAASSLFSFLRKSKNGEAVLIVCNFTPVPRDGYRVGVPHGGYWQELLNSDAREDWGSGMGNAGGVWAEPQPWHGKPFSLVLTLPPLGCLFLKT